MQGISAPMPNIVPAVRFESSAEFQKRNLTHQGDSGFAQFQRKSWMRPAHEKRCNREALTTLLSAHGDNASECIEKLIAADISYRDLASLTHVDLELIGFRNVRERNELLAFFAELPNQDPSFETICSIVEAKSYNRDILKNAIDHLENMRSAMAAANYKLKIMPTEDFVVNEKHFASYFVLEALSELKTVSTDIDKELQELQLITGEQKIRKKPKTKRNSIGYWTLYCTIAAASTMAALWFLKLRKST